MIGEKFGHYRIEEKLGEGGMGVVYRATDLQLDRAVAIKTLPATEGESSVETTQRFLREAKATSRLQHPSIVTIHHVGVEGDTRYVVMEMVDGENLESMINGRPMDPTQICDIGIQVADGLAVAHEAGVVHRDIKAENVMIGPRGQVKILDFGLAKLREVTATTNDPATRLTKVGTIMGTVTHMSPEQALGTDVDFRTDIFSFGVMLYEMATGRLPFEASTVQATLARILNQEPKPAEELNPTLPPDLGRIILECLSKDRVLRPSLNDIVGQLKAIRFGLTGERPVSTMMTRTQQLAAGTTAQPSSSSTQAMKPPSAAQSKLGSSAAARPGSTVEPPKHPTALKAAYWTLRVFRYAVSLTTLTIPLAFLAYFVIGGGIIKPEVLEGTRLLRYIQVIVLPALELSQKLFTFRPIVDGWNLMLAGFAIVTFVLRQLALLPIEKVEHKLRSKMIYFAAAAPKSADVGPTDTRSSSRLAMLREYTETKKALFQEKRHLAFLAIDVVGSTKMKIGEDKLVIEHAFVEYKKFIERILKNNEIWKVAWTPDGIMCAFPTSQDAANAAQEVLRGLDWFNNGVHQLRTKFNVRCGVNAGEVVFPESKRMEEVSDEAVDCAGHMQKYAAPGTVWVSALVHDELKDHSGFKSIDTKVDGHRVFEWRAEAKAQDAANSA
jgi:serine/threonine protein kinase/class 3 adenylate cyclase